MSIEPRHLRPTWDERVATIARLIPPGSRVIDLGAGARTLEGMLPPGCAYTPADLERTEPRTLPLNFDEGVWPKGRWDVAVMSGSIEYAADPLAALWRLRSLAPRALVSYEHGGTLGRRRLNGFKSHLSKAGIEAAFEATGWSHKEVARWRTQVIYRLEEMR